MALTRPKYSNIVDSDYKQSCRVVTTTNITLSGGAPSTYDGISLAAGNRVLVTAQDVATENGIYTVQTVGTGSTGTWTRSFDANDGSRLNSGAQVAIGEGTDAGKIYLLTTPDPITVGSTALTFVYRGGNPGGTDGEVQYNSVGALTGNSAFTFNQTTGNVTVGRLRSTNGLFWSGNNNPITTGITYTASTTSPAGARPGDQWYNTSTQVLYEYVNDGTSSYWVDIQTQVLAANTIACLPLTGGTITYTPATTTGAAIQTTGKDTQGGVGYFDFLKATNTTSGATNPNKSFRLNSTGFLEIINSAYTATLLSLSDAGVLSANSAIQINGKKAVNGPAFRAYPSGSQTITSGSLQKVTFGSESFDTDGCFASSTFTPTVEGYYQLNATVRLDGANGTGECMIVLYKNGSEYARGWNSSGTQFASSFWSMTVTDVAYANGTTDYFEIYIQQTSGGSLTTTAFQNISYFSGCMIRGA